MDKKFVHVFCFSALIILILSSMTTVIGFQPPQSSPLIPDSSQSPRDGIIVSGTMGENGWYISGVMVIFNFSGPPAPWWYRINESSWMQYSTPIILDSDGIYLIEATSDFVTIYNVTVKIDKTPPTVIITQPKRGYLYICLLNYIFKIIPLHYLTTIIIGRINVTVNATDNQSGVNRVEFFVDGSLKSTDTHAPYFWIWSDRGLFFPYSLEVKAFDDAGNYNSIIMKIWKIF